MKSLLRTILVMSLLCTMGSANTIHALSTYWTPASIQPPEWRDMKLKELINLSSKDISRLSGRKITLREKYIFFIMKGKMKQEVKKHPEMTFNEFMVPIKQKDKIGLILLGIIVVALIGLVILVNQLPR